MADLQIEWHKGDVDLEPERLVFDRDVVRSVVHGLGARAVFEPRDEHFGASLLAHASPWVCKGRARNKSEIAGLLSLFRLPYSDNDGPLAFCAAGVSYIAAEVYAALAAARGNAPAPLVTYLGDVDFHHFTPTPSVIDMHHGAVSKRRWLGADPKTVTPLPGWLVMFSFEKPFDHVGIVERYHAGVLHTIEFNTHPEGDDCEEASDGMVARRKRKYASSLVKGFVKTDIPAPF
jgi:hypothetical protein